MPFFLGYCHVELFLPQCRSLKDKRSVIKGLLDRARRKFGAAAAEVDYLDNWQRSGLVFSLVSNEQAHLRESLNALLRYVEETCQCEVTSHSLEIM